MEEGNDIVTSDGRIGTDDLGTRWERCRILRRCGGERCYVGVVEDIGNGDRVGCCSAIVGEGTGGRVYWTAPVQVGIQWLWVGSGVGCEGAFM